MGTTFICFSTAPDSMRHPPSGTNVTVGESSTTVTRFRAAQGQFAGLDQIDAQLPSSLAGAGQVTVNGDGQSGDGQPGDDRVPVIGRGGKGRLTIGLQEVTLASNRQSCG
jgi:hypothetical protein